MDYKSLFDRDGFVHFKNIFDPEAIIAARQEILDEAKKRFNEGQVLNESSIKPSDQFFVPNGDLLTWSNLIKYDFFMFSDVVLSLVRSLLGSKDLIYFFDSSFFIGSGYSGFHKDNTYRTSTDNIDWHSSDYSILRAGLYFQNHDKYSGGVSVRVGSHKCLDLNRGRIKNIPSTVGDLVLWNMKTTHSGNTRLFRYLRSPASPSTSSRINRFFPRLAKKIFLPYESTRVSLFCAFAIPNHPQTHAYIEKITKRKTNYIGYVPRKLDQFIPSYLRSKDLIYSVPQLIDDSWDSSLG